MSGQRLPKGSEVLYRTAPRLPNGRDELRDIIEASGAKPLPFDGPDDEFPGGDHPDAVLIFAGGLALGAELVLLARAWRAGMRATLIPPARLPARAREEAWDA